MMQTIKVTSNAPIGRISKIRLNLNTVMISFSTNYRVFDLIFTLNDIERIAVK